MDLRTDAISIEMREMSLALRTAVSARRGASSDEVSSVESVTGLPECFVTRSRANCSCAGLRTAKAAAMAKASTGMLAMAVSRATTSRAAASLPPWSWPPPIRAIGMPGKALAMPVRSAIAWSKPMSRTPTALPWPSTTALVASVVDTETSAMFSGLRPAGSAAMAAVMAPVTPIDKSPLVVIALAEAKTLWPSASITAASV